MTATQAFSLLTLPNATLRSQGHNQTGVLNLECVTVAVPEASAPSDRDVYLLLRLDSIEAPIDPSWVIKRSDIPGWQTYTFRSTESSQDALVLSLPVDEKAPTNYLEDLETFESLLSQYADLQIPQNNHAQSGSHPLPPPEKSDLVGSALPGAHGDLRGHIVAINEDTGEVIGQFDDSQFQVREDPVMHEKGHENDVVMIEVPDSDRSGAHQDASALQMFVRVVPPEERDWITKSAGMVSHAISTTTSLLLTTITTASNYYINHSKPSPHHPSQVAQRAPEAPPPPPSRTLVFLTSERTRRGLAGVHAVSGKAVSVSAKTVNKIDDMIRSAMGRKARKPRQFAMSQGHRDIYGSSSSQPSSGMLSPQSGMTSPIPRTPSPSGKSNLDVAPPPYPGNDKASSRGRSPSPIPPPLPPRTVSGIPEGGPSFSHHGTPPPLPPRKPLNKKAKLMLSIDLILSTIDHETRRLLDGGQQTVGNVVGHRYGPQARETSDLMTGTAKNVGLVYVDMRGIGRRALLKKAGTHWVKGRLHPQDVQQQQQQQQAYGQAQAGPSQMYSPPSAQGKH